MKRLLLHLGLLASCTATVVINTYVLHAIGFSLFTFTFWIMIPAGALMLGCAAGSGYLGAAYLFHIRPNKTDFAFLVVTIAVACFALEYADYWTFYLQDGRPARDIVPFSRYFMWSITSPHLRVSGSVVDARAVGDFGYVLFACQSIGFLVSSLSIQGFTVGLPSCASCHSYLRKVRVKVSTAIPSRTTEALMQLASGSFADLQHALNWKPDGTLFANEKSDTQVVYTLFECPNCKREVVTAVPQLQTKRGWQDIENLKVRRNIAAGSTMFAEFK